MERSVIVIDSHFPGLNPMQFGSEECAPGHFFGPAVRTYWLLHYVTSGKGTFTRDGVTYQLQAGDLFVISPYLETYYEADQNSPGVISGLDLHWTNRRHRKMRRHCCKSR